MGFPFKIKNPIDIPPGGSWAISDNDIKTITEQNEALIEIRGRVITAALLIEQKMDDILAIVFVGKDAVTIRLFKEMLLEKEFFTFMNKLKIFRDITKRKIINFEKEEERNNLCTKIQKLIETRDRFAHGDIVFSGTQPELTYMYENEKKNEVLNNEYFDNINAAMGEVDYTLDHLLRFLKGEVEGRPNPSEK